VLVGVLALQGDLDEHTEALADLDVASRPVRRREDLRGLDGIVLPGGESTTMSMLLESSQITEPLGAQLQAGLPVFGTCAGMILLAGAISDGRRDQRCYGTVDIVVRRNGYGRQLDSFECDLQVESVGAAPLHAIFIRAPVVESAGADVEVLARLELADGASGVGTDGKSTPVVCRQRNALVSSFHPELTPDRRLHEMFVSMVEDRIRVGGRRGA